MKVLDRIKVVGGLLAVGLVVGGCGSSSHVDTHKRPTRSVADVQRSFHRAGVTVRETREVDESRLLPCLRAQFRAAVQRVAPSAWFEVSSGLPAGEFVVIAVGSRNPGGINGAGCSKDVDVPASRSRPPQTATLTASSLDFQSFTQDGNVVIVFDVGNPVRFDRALKLLFS